jgi:hypothetical protein
MITSQRFAFLFLEGGGFRKISKDDSKFHYARRLPVRLRAATSTAWIFVRFIFGVCWHIAIWVGAGQK